jgi:hypothetical protein
MKTFQLTNEGIFLGIRGPRATFGPLIAASRYLTKPDPLKCALDNSCFPSSRSKLPARLRDGASFGGYRAGNSPGIARRKLTRIAYQGRHRECHSSG